MLSKAKKFIDQSLSLSQDLGKKNSYKNALGNLADFYLAKSDYKKAYESYVDYTKMKDSIFNEQLANKIHSLTQNFEIEQKELEIANLQKEQALQTVKLQKRERTKPTVISGKVHVGRGSVIDVAGDILCHQKLPFKAKANRELSEKNHLIIKQKKDVEFQKELVEEKNNENTDSINYAKRIQEAILPGDETINNLLGNGFVFFRPKDVVSGDFYFLDQVVQKDKKITFIAAVDCTGHGVPGAMVSMLGYNGLKRANQEFHLYDPAKILDRLCELIAESFSQYRTTIKDGMDIALVAIEEGSDQKTVHLSGANNPMWLVNPNRSDWPEDMKPFKTGGGAAFPATKTGHWVS